MPTARSTSLQLLTAEEKYLAWFNGQMLGIGREPVEDISESLASGVLIILAVAVSALCMDGGHFSLNLMWMY